MAEQEIKASLKKRTKEELIWLFEFMDKYRNHSLDYALTQLNLRMVDLKLKEAEDWANTAEGYREKYLELLKEAKSSGFNSALQAEMYELLCDAEDADNRYEKCIEEADSYGLRE